MLKNTKDSYGLISKIFHWLMSFMIITVIIVGFVMSSMEPSDQKWEIYASHKATGVIILFLVSLRLLWKLLNVKVQDPDNLNILQTMGLKITHYLLYLCMFMMPSSGILMSRYAGFEINVFGLFTIPAFDKNMELAGIFKAIHEVTAFGIVALILMHFLAAMYHHFIRKDNVLMRMIK